MSVLFSRYIQSQTNRKFAYKLKRKSYTHANNETLGARITLICQSFVPGTSVKLFELFRNMVFNIYSNI